MFHFFQRPAAQLIPVATCLAPLLDTVLQSGLTILATEDQGAKSLKII